VAVDTVDQCGTQIVRNEALIKPAHDPNQRGFTPWLFQDNQALVVLLVIRFT